MASGTDFHFPIPVSKPVLELDDGRYDSVNVSGDSRSKKAYQSKKHKQLCSVRNNEAITQPVSSFVPQSVLVGSLLEHLCSLYESDAEKSKKLFESICVQLEKLNVVSSVTYQEEYASIRSQYKASFYNIIHSVRYKFDSVPLPISLKGNESNLIPLGKRHSSSDKVFKLVPSRYQEEFEEICELGKGAFGKVFKARNKIDRQDYAVKKIDFKHIDLDSDRQQVKKIMREVESLAALQHPHVVRYHHSWMEHSIEVMEIKTEVNGSKSMSSSQNQQSITNNLSENFHDFKPSICSNSTDLSWGESSSDHAKPLKNGKFWIGQDEDDLSASESKNSGDSKRKQCVKFPDQSSPPSDVVLTHGVRRDHMKRVQSVIFNTQTGNPAAPFPILRSNNNVVRSKSTNSLKDIQLLNGVRGKSNPVILSHPSLHSHSSAITLFIQMQICDSSLQQWLKMRNNASNASENLLSLDDQEISLDIYKQLLSALSYIHEKEIMHRDLKPRNIFLNGCRPHVLLGDFGLSRPAVSRHSSTVATPPATEDSFVTFDDLEEHTSGIGTTSYAAPEQLAHENYDFKADMYSAGIILFELTWRLQTDHERYVYIKRLRQEDVPAEYTEHWGDTAQILQSLLSYEPNDRPSASELLDKSLFSSSKSKDIASLEAENKKLRCENSHLKMLVANYQSKFKELGIDPDE